MRQGWRSHLEWHGLRFISLLLLGSLSLLGNGARNLVQSCLQHDVDSTAGWVLDLGRASLATAPQPLMTATMGAHMGPKPTSVHHRREWNGQRSGLTPNLEVV